MFLDVPCGYVKLPTGEVALDPDEQARATVQLIFDKFDELGSCWRLYHYLVRNKIRLGMRVHRGPRRGQLDWRLPSRARWPDAPSPDLRGGLFLRPPPRRSQADGRGGRQAQDARGADVGVDGARTGPPAGLYHVGTLPGQPAAAAAEPLAARLARGAPRRHGAADGPAGLRDLWPAHVRQLSEQVDRPITGACGGRTKDRRVADSKAAAVDDLVAQQVLRALEPAALELSLKAIEDVQQERERLHRHWKQRLERATYEAERGRTAIPGGRAREPSRGPQPGAAVGGGAATAARSCRKNMTAF